MAKRRAKFWGVEAMRWGRPAKRRGDEAMLWGRPAKRRRKYLKYLIPRNEKKMKTS